jgi:hypothetical protein
MEDTSVAPWSRVAYDNWQLLQYSKFNFNLRAEKSPILQTWVVLFQSVVYYNFMKHDFAAVE